MCFGTERFFRGIREEFETGSKAGIQQMRQATRKGLMTVAAATGVIAAAGGSAHADSGAQGSASGSPGEEGVNSTRPSLSAPGRDS